MNKLLHSLILILAISHHSVASPISDIIDSIKEDVRFVDTDRIIGSETQKEALKQFISFGNTVHSFQDFVINKYPDHEWSDFQAKTKSISLTAEFLSADDFTLTEENENQLTYRSVENQEVKLQKNESGLWALDLAYIFGQVREEDLKLANEMTLYFESVLKTEMKRAKEHDYSFGLLTTMVNIAGLASRPDILSSDRKESIEESLGRSLDEVRESYLKKE